MIIELLILTGCQFKDSKPDICRGESRNVYIETNKIAKLENFNYTQNTHDQRYEFKGCRVEIKPKLGHNVDYWSSESCDSIKSQTK